MVYLIGNLIDDDLCRRLLEFRRVPSLTAKEGWIRALELGRDAPVSRASPSPGIKPREEDKASVLDDLACSLSSLLVEESESVHIRSTCLESAPETSTPIELLRRPLFFSNIELRTAEFSISPRCEQPVVCGCDVANDAR